MSPTSSARLLLFTIGSALAASALLAGQLTWAGDDTGVVRLSEPVEVTDTHETFGAVISTPADPISLSTLVQNHEDYEGSSVVVETRVSQVCQKKGCFFIAQDGDTTVRVAFKDYGFFVPTDISGRRVTLVGELKRVELSEEQAAHLEEDLQSAEVNVAPGPQFEIVASVVRVPKS